jgi:oligopeptide transport system substrate-binding protein
VPLKPARFPAALLVAACIAACDNSPFPADERSANILYSTFTGQPAHLDPARSYSSDEYLYIQQIYEPVVQYHLLKRPYELVPLTATEVPHPEYFDAEGKSLPPDAPPEEVARAVYTIRLRPGIRYQNHPCFAKDDEGRPRYLSLTERAMRGISALEHFPHTGTRVLTAHDYVWQIKRLAHPALECPILPVLEEAVEGMHELAGALSAELGRIRAERKAAVGALYNQERDERANPIFLDLDRFELPGARALDDLTLQIVLKKKYPQMKYWLAMPFFAPMPKEADRFYAQGPLVERSITLDTSAVGTGAFRFETFNPNMEIVLTRNENYRGDPYPSEGMPEDRDAGLLADAGRPTPFLDKAVYKLERESNPRWIKFLQGYYDASTIGSDVFDRAVSLSSSGTLDLSEEMKAKGIRLVTDPEPTLYYFAFNMLDDVVGGYTPERKKLRQAIAIAMDMEEYIQIFRNGRDLVPHGPIPPGIFGHRTGREGMNPLVYDWDEQAGAPRRKPIEEAKRLLAEAGFPGGRGPDGKPLVLYFDNMMTGAEAKAELDWIRKQFAKIGIDLQTRTTDYNRFQEKAKKGNFQILWWGWIADYPDPENFLFLLYGPNSKVKADGENAANYDNPEFNALFARMESMEDGPERQEIVDRMTRIIREDGPWIPHFFVVEYVLFHSWYGNNKAMSIGGGALKYRRIDPEARRALREEWNSPVWWPLVALALALAAVVAPGVAAVRKGMRRGAHA